MINICERLEVLWATPVRPGRPAVVRWVCVRTEARTQLSECSGENTLLKLGRTSHVQPVFQRHPVLNACRDWGSLTGWGAEILDAFY